MSIKLNECGTIPVMEWIRANGCPTLKGQDFSCNGKSFMIVSSLDAHDLDHALREWPLDEWANIGGMRRIALPVFAEEPIWYFYIDNHFYYATR